MASKLIILPQKNKQVQGYSNVSIAKSFRIDSGLEISHKKSPNVRFIDDFQTFHEPLGMLNFKTDMIYLILRPRNETTQPKSHNFSCNKFSF